MNTKILLAIAAMAIFVGGAAMLFVLQTTEPDQTPVSSTTNTTTNVVGSNGVITTSSDITIAE